MARAPKPKQFICKVEGCKRDGKPFTRKADLERHHTSVHTDIKFECPVCGHRTGQKSNLDNHIRTHTKQMLTCPDCDFQATNHTSIHTHRKNIHKYQPKQRKSKQASPSPASPAEPGPSSQPVASTLNNSHVPNSQSRDSVKEDQSNFSFIHNSLPENLYNPNVFGLNPFLSDMKPSTPPYKRYPYTCTPTMSMPSPKIMDAAIEAGPALEGRNDINPEAVVYVPPPYPPPYPSIPNNTMPTQQSWPAYSSLSYPAYAGQYMGQVPQATTYVPDVALDNPIGYIFTEAELDEFINKISTSTFTPDDFPSVVVDEETTQFMPDMTAPGVLPYEDCWDWRDWHFQQNPNGFN